MERLQELDTQLFRLINGHQASWLDWPMWLFSQHAAWAVVLVALFALVVLRHDARHWWLPVAGVVLCFLLADQVSVHLFKDLFARPRPCHTLANVNMFRTNCGGMYGFVSSHAANAFAVATFITLRYWCRVKPSWPTAVALYAWAAIVCYSRVYLGKHYPGDVLCGALLGALLGALVWWLTELTERKFVKKIAQK